MKFSKVLVAMVTVLGVSGLASAADGEAIYKKACFACHDQAVAGAPKFGDKDAWKDRIATGDDAMFNNVKNGKNAMPAKGTCADCSDDDLKAAIKYMVDKAK